MQLASTDCMELCHHSGSAVSQLTRRSLSAMQHRGVHLYDIIGNLCTQRGVELLFGCRSSNQRRSCMQPLCF